MDELIAVILEQEDTETTLNSIQELANHITKLSLTVEADKIKSKGLSKEELIKKENDR